MGVNDPKPSFELQGANILRTSKDLNIKGFFVVTNTETQILKGQKIGRKIVSNSIYSVSASDFLIGITSLSVAPSIGLPDARNVGVGKSYIIKDEVGGAITTNVTIRSDNERTIDGSSSTTLAANYASKSFYSDGSNWFTY